MPRTQIEHLNIVEVVQIRIGSVGLVLGYSYLSVGLDQ